MYVCVYIHLFICIYTYICVCIAHVGNLPNKTESFALSTYPNCAEVLREVAVGYDRPLGPAWTLRELPYRGV